MIEERRRMPPLAGMKNAGKWLGLEAEESLLPNPSSFRAAPRRMRGSSQPVLFCQKSLQPARSGARDLLPGDYPAPQPQVEDLHSLQRRVPQLDQVRPARVRQQTIRTLPGLRRQHSSNQLIARKLAFALGKPLPIEYLGEIPVARHCRLRSPLKIALGQLRLCQQAPQAHV